MGSLVVMCHKNNMPGMTLPEVLIALATIAVLLIPLMVVQTSIFNQITNLSYQLEQMWHAQKVMAIKNSFYRYQGNNTEEKETFGSPLPAVYTYRKIPVAKGSSVPVFSGLYRTEVVIETTFKQKKIKNSFVSYSFQPERKKDEKGRINSF